VKLRYRSPPAACTVEAREAGNAEIRLETPLVRPAPGQIAVLLAGERVVGHARACAPPIGC
jgi:tRNA U34 2-thiouridine synthase MnmA/TrmU